MHRKSRKTILFSLIFIGFAVILSLSIILTKTIYFEYHAKKEMLHQAVDVAKIKENKLGEFLNKAERNTLALSKSSFFLTYYNQGVEKEELEQFFLSYAGSSADIMKVRYIDKTGKEVIRVERNGEGSNPVIVREEALQDKSDRYFFVESKTKEAGKVWFSAFDLNQDNGIIEMPIQPTFRTILPLEKGNEFDGIIIVNYYSSGFLKDFGSDTLYNMVIFNDVGDVIYIDEDINQTKLHSWGNVLADKSNIRVEFSEDADTMMSYPFLETKDYVVKKMELPIHGGFHILLKLSNSYLTSERMRLHREYVTIVVVILCFSSILTYVIVRIFSRSLLNYDKIQLLYESMNSASEVAGIGFWEFDPKTQMVRWNARAYNVFERDSGEREITYEQFKSYLLEEEREQILGVFMKSISHRTEFAYTHRILTEKGHIKFVEQRAKHIYDRHGKHSKTVGSIYDITEIKETEQLLVNKSKEQKALLSIFDVSDSVILKGNTNEKFEISYISNSVEKLLGYSKEDFLTGKISYRNCIHTDDYDQVKKEIMESDFTKNSFIRHIPYRMVTKTGYIKWVHAQTVAEINEQGIPIHYIIYIVDITKEKEYEETLLKQQEQMFIVNQKLEHSIETLQNTSNLYEMERRKYKTILELASDGILLMDLDGNMVDFSNKILELLGYAEEEMRQLSVYVWDKEITKDEWKNLLNLMVKQPIEIERFHTRKDGSTYYAHIMANLVLIKDETFVYASVRDISKAKEIQKELEDSKLRWQFAVEGNKDGLWDWNVDTGEAYFSPQWKKMIGYEDDDEIAGKEEWTKRIHKEDIAHVEQDLNDYFTGTKKSYVCEFRMLCKDGTYRWIRARGIVVERNKDGSPHRLIGTHTDITEYVNTMEFIKKQTYIDELTQLNNRKAYNERIHELLEQYRRYDVPFSFLMLDIDFFKTINDNYGHAMGDKVLVELANILKDITRKNDYVFRIGGEEFVILLTGTKKQKAVIFAEKIRCAMEENLQVLFENRKQVTVSLGVVEVQKNDSTDSIFARCDEHLYKAKQGGRNRVDA